MTANRSPGATPRPRSPRREPGDPVEMLAERGAVLAVEEADAIGVALHGRQQQPVVDELFHRTIPLGNRPDSRMPRR